jgi:putative FmdB family regulatory protein
MPLYEFKCRTCEDTFEVRRPMSEAGDPATCPQGHDGAVRLLSVFASVGASGSGAPAPAARPAGGGCGGACACAH